MSTPTPIPVIPESIHRAMPACGDNLALDPAFHNAAVTRCCNAWKIVYKAERAKGTPGVSCYLRANEAFRYAMPPLTTAQNIRDFLACAAFGMIARTIDMIVANKLLYAAQIASSAQRSAFNAKHPHAKSAPKAKKTRAQSGSRKQPRGEK